MLDPTSGQYCSDGNGCEGTYEADLFTWLYDKGYAVSGTARTATVPLRVAWYRGADKGTNLLGLFHGQGVEKQVHLHTCGTRPPDSANTDDGILPRSNDHLVTFYNQHRHSGCYGQPAS